MGVPSLRPNLRYIKYHVARHTSADRPDRMSIPDNGPVIEGALWPICVVSLLFLVTRLYVRFTRNRSFWWDDWVLIASWFCLLGQTLTAQTAIGYGFGKHLENIDPPSNIYQIALNVQIAAILPWVQCRPFMKVFDHSLPGDCFDPSKVISYAIFVAAWNALMDFVLAALPWSVLWKLNMNSTEKMGVGLCMSLGILAGSIAIVRACYIPQITKKDFFYNGVELICWSASESAAAIIGASIPVLRVFIREKTTSAGYSASRGARRDNVQLSRVGGSRAGQGFTPGHQRSLGHGAQQERWRERQEHTGGECWPFRQCTRRNHSADEHLSGRHAE